MYLSRQIRIAITMIVLEGKNLCERQRHLNLKVNEAAKGKVDLQAINPDENSDVDRIFNIDLASKYKNTEYIVQELKSGDSLYVSRALKCEWLYDAEHAYIINPDYLHHHVFPMMSIKIKKKMLSAISNHVKDEIRAELFCEYCMNTNQEIQAYKFLVFTSESFKEKFLTDDDKARKLYNEIDRKNYYKNLIGNSFNLADIYMRRHLRSINNLSYLYSVNEDMYLDLYEKHTLANYSLRVGKKISRSILKKHKNKVLWNPLLYMTFLNEKQLVTYSTSEDAIVYITALLPEKADKFWDLYLYSNYKHIFKIIKTEESMYKFLKKLFNTQYPEEEFEMSSRFYSSKYYDLMTSEERETWAINHLENHTGVIPESDEYRWYEFVTFGKAFAEIKRLIMITTDQHKRSDMLKVLAKSAKTQEDLKELLDYYYKRHVNESKDRKETFTREIIKQHKVFELEDACWDALHKIFHSLEIYTSPSWQSGVCLVVSFIYHVIHGKTLPKGLVIENLDFYVLEEYLDKINEENKKEVFRFLVQYTVNKISEFDTRDYNGEVQKEVLPYLTALKKYFKMFKEEDKYPEIALKYMKLDRDRFQYMFEDKEPETEITEGHLLRCLKEDASHILEKLPLIKKSYSKFSTLRLNLLLKKIKIYFQNDVAKSYLDYFLQTLSDEDEYNGYIITATVYAIFQLGDDKLKSEVMDKYAPTNPKVEHGIIDQRIYEIQVAICRLHCYSRPPLPLAKSALYIKGDYVHKCDEMFNFYLATLPPAIRTDFIRMLLDAPLSIQKRGLRLAFQSFQSADLKNLVSNVWKKTKNVSLRNILYKSLVDKVAKEKENAQNLFELLIELTGTIHEDDDDAVFGCFSGYELPEHFRRSYLQTAWATVAALSAQKSANNERKKAVMKAMTSNMNLLDEKYLVPIIRSHIQEMLLEQKLRPESNSGIAELNNAKWDLVAQYIVEDPNEAKIERSLDVLQSIVDECFNQWNSEHGTGEYVYQSFLSGFIDKVDNMISYFGPQDYRAIHAYLLKRFETRFDISEMYSYLWYFKLAILTRTVADGRNKLDKEVYVNFGLQLAKMIVELKDSNRFFTFFIPKIVEKISSFIRQVTYVRNEELTEEDLSILVAYGLAQTVSDETLILALEILPLDLNSTPAVETELPQIFKKIREHNNKEVIAFMNEKFIYGDHKVRKSLQ